jgi:hypothetical protein
MKRIINTLTICAGGPFVKRASDRDMYHGYVSRSIDRARGHVLRVHVPTGDLIGAEKWL